MNDEGEIYVYENGKVRRVPSRAELDAQEERRLLEEQQELRWVRLVRRWNMKHTETAA